MGVVRQIPDWLRSRLPNATNVPECPVTFSDAPTNDHPLTLDDDMCLVVN